MLRGLFRLIVLVIVISAIVRLISPVFERLAPVRSVTINGVEHEYKTDKDLFSLGPVTQQYFADFISDARAKEKEAETQALKKMVWLEANDKLCRDFDIFAPRRNWIGIVDWVHLWDDFKLSLHVKFDDHDNELHDPNIRENPSLSDAEKNMAMGLDKGDIVRFSGTFYRLRESVSECLVNTVSRTLDDGVLHDKNFIFRFDSLEKIATKKVEK